MVTILNNLIEMAQDVANVGIKYKCQLTMNCFLMIIVIDWNIELSNRFRVYSGKTTF